jgi:hypothetical protein
MIYSFEEEEVSTENLNVESDGIAYDTWVKLNASIVLYIFCCPLSEKENKSVFFYF